MRMTGYMLLSTIPQSKRGLVMLLIIISIPLALMIVASPFIIVLACKAHIQKNRKDKEERRRGVTIHTALLHKFGLPILENSKCEVFSYADKIEFKSRTTVVTLARDKITDMAIKTYTQVRHQLVSSAGDAIAGAMAFGSIGASIGGRIRNEKIITSTKYLFITYTDNRRRISYLCFDITTYPENMSKYYASELVREFKKLNTTSGIQIEL